MVTSQHRFLCEAVSLSVHKNPKVGVFLHTAHMGRGGAGRGGAQQVRELFRMPNAGQERGTANLGLAHDMTSPPFPQKSCPAAEDS